MSNLVVNVLALYFNKPINELEKVDEKLAEILALVKKYKANEKLTPGEKKKLDLELIDYFSEPDMIKIVDSTYIIIIQ